jgi:hypothetical protein
MKEIDKIIDSALKRSKILFFNSFIQQVKNKKCTYEEYNEIINNIANINEPEMKPFNFNGTDYLIDTDNVVYHYQLKIPVGFYNQDENIIIYNE